MTKITKTALLIGFAGVAFLAGGRGQATTVLHQAFPDLVQKAETIVVGTVSTIHTEWDAARETPYTLVTFTDLDVRKGNPHPTALTLQFVGGPAPDSTVLQIAGVPEFHLGDRLVLFVAGNRHYAVPLVGLWQGVYRVVFDQDRATETVYTHAMQPVTTLPTDSGGLQHDEPKEEFQAMQQSSAPAMTLDAFLDRIAEEVGHD